MPAAAVKAHSVEIRRRTLEWEGPTPEKAGEAGVGQNMRGSLKRGRIRRGGL